jgi:anti-anti-sigma regulatory factor
MDVGQRLHGGTLQPTLSCEIVAYPEPFVVKLSGEIDVANYEQVAALAQHPANGHGTVIFDAADTADEP